jgi:hypothetical protein
VILSCAHCDRQYDAAELEPRSVVRCECGNLLIVPDPEQLESPTVIHEYLERWAGESGKTAASLQVDGGWEFVAGSAIVRIEHDLSENTISIESLLMSIPDAAERRLALFAKLLELNYRATGEARFAVHRGQVTISFTRPTLGLDYLEFQRAVEEVARTADDYDEELAAEFGARIDDE